MSPGRALLVVTLPVVALLAACGPAPAVGRGLTDVTASSGVDFAHVHGGHNKRFLFETMGSGVAATDFDSDGAPDLLFLQSGSLPPAEFTAAERERAGHAAGATHRLYRNQGGMHFDDVTAGSGLDVACYAMGVAVGDVDADGDRDVFIASYGEDRLYANDGQARFHEGVDAGVSDPRWTMGGAFVDVDLDGDLDLFTVAYLDMPIASHRVCGPSADLRTYCHVDAWDGLDDRLLLNDGRGRFSDGSVAAGLVGTAGKGLAVVAGDWDDDGDADLFVANDSQANLVLRNDGGGAFTDVGRRSGADLNDEGRTEACMGVDLGDLDADGDLDLFVANFENETNTLYRNDGDGYFTDVSISSGVGAASMKHLGFGTLMLDVEQDGDLDVYVTNGHILASAEAVNPRSRYAQPDQLLLNDGRGHFAPADDTLCPALSEPRVGRGLARADLDGDGDHDLVVSNSNDRPWILRNDMAWGHRIALRLLGPGGRADAEGARVTVRVGDRTLVRELVAGGSYASHSDSELIVGLGHATRVDALTIRWPGGATTELTELPADARYVLGADGQVVSRADLPPAAGHPPSP